MVSLMRWEPFSELRRMERSMDRSWGPRLDLFRTRPIFYNGHQYAPVDIYEDADRLVVKVAVPGVKPEELDVTVTDKGACLSHDAFVAKRIYQLHQLLVAPVLF